MAARAQSEMRRTQQLKIIEGARAKVQSVIDARTYFQPFSAFFSGFPVVLNYLTISKKLF